MPCLALTRDWLTLAGETTFAVIVETDDDLEPSTNKPADGVCRLWNARLLIIQSLPPWVPALSADTLQPSQDASMVKNEPLLNVKAVETGVIDVSCSVSIPLYRADNKFRLMVQECVAKTGLEHLSVG